MMAEVTPPSFPSFIPPPEDVLKERLKKIKTELGRIAYIAIKGEKAAVGKIAGGIELAAGGLNYLARVMREHIEEK